MAASAQVPQPGPGDEEGKAAAERFCRDEGTNVRINGNPGWVPKSVGDLTGKAQLVVEAEVESIFPATVTVNELMNLTPMRGFVSLTTDAILRVVRSLKNSPPSTRIVIAQPGGQLDKCSTIVSSYPSFMGVGEHYFLFLNEASPTTTRSFPDRSGLPRYNFALHEGVLRIDANGLLVVPQFLSRELRRSLEGATPEQVVTEVQASVESQLRQ